MIIKVYNSWIGSFKPRLSAYLRISITQMHFAEGESRMILIFQEKVKAIIFS